MYCSSHDLSVSDSYFEKFNFGAVTVGFIFVKILFIMFEAMRELTVLLLNWSIGDLAKEIHP